MTAGTTSQRVGVQLRIYTLYMVSPEWQALTIPHTFSSVMARGRQMLSSRSSSRTSSLEKYKAAKTGELNFHQALL